MEPAAVSLPHPPTYSPVLVVCARVALRARCVWSRVMINSGSPVREEGGDEGREGERHPFPSTPSWLDFSCWHSRVVQCTYMYVKYIRACM